MKKRVAAESVNSSSSACSNLEPFANDEPGNFCRNFYYIIIFRGKMWMKLVKLHFA